MALLLEETSLAADGLADRNGINTIGFVAPEDGFNAATANLFIEGGTIVECDITVGAVSDGLYGSASSTRILEPDPRQAERA